MDLRKGIVVIVMVAAMVGAFSPSLRSLDRPHTRPSYGCHEHGDKAPARSYDCCLTGHDVAAPQAFHYFRPALESVDFEFIVSPRSSSEVIALDVSILPVLRPPGATFLRI